MWRQRRDWGGSGLACSSRADFSLSLLLRCLPVLVALLCAYTEQPLSPPVWVVVLVGASLRHTPCNLLLRMRCALLLLGLAALVALLSIPQASARVIQAARETASLEEALASSEAQSSPYFSFADLDDPVAMMEITAPTPSTPLAVTDATPPVPSNVTRAQAQTMWATYLARFAASKKYTPAESAKRFEIFFGNLQKVSEQNFLHGGGFSYLSAFMDRTKDEFKAMKGLMIKKPEEVETSGVAGRERAKELRAKNYALWNTFRKANPHAINPYRTPFNETAAGKAKVARYRLMKARKAAAKAKQSSKAAAKLAQKKAPRGKVAAAKSKAHKAAKKATVATKRAVAAVKKATKPTTPTKKPVKKALPKVGSKAPKRSLFGFDEEGEAMVEVDAEEGVDAGAEAHGWLELEQDAEESDADEWLDAPVMDLDSIADAIARADQAALFGVDVGEVDELEDQFAFSNGARRDLEEQVRADRAAQKKAIADREAARAAAAAAAV